MSETNTEIAKVSKFNSSAERRKRNINQSSTLKINVKEEEQLTNQDYSIEARATERKEEAISETDAIDKCVSVDCADLLDLFEFSEEYLEMSGSFTRTR